MTLFWKQTHLIIPAFGPLTKRDRKQGAVTVSGVQYCTLLTSADHSRFSKPVPATRPIKHKLNEQLEVSLCLQRWVVSGCSQRSKDGCSWTHPNHEIHQHGNMFVCWFHFISDVLSARTSSLGQLDADMSHMLTFHVLTAHCEDSEHVNTCWSLGFTN